MVFSQKGLLPKTSVHFTYGSFALSSFDYFVFLKGLKLHLC